MNRSCLLQTRGNTLFGVVPNMERDDHHVEFVFVNMYGQAERVKVDVPQIAEMLEILHAFMTVNPNK